MLLENKRMWLSNSIQEDVELYCENRFKETHSRTENGPYVIKMTMDDENKLGQWQS